MAMLPFIFMENNHHKTHFGGADGELAASMRYLHQRYSMPYKEVVGILTDVGSEASEMFHYCNASKTLGADSLLIYTITTKERVLRYGENNRVAFFEQPITVTNVKERKIRIHSTISLLNRFVR